MKIYEHSCVIEGKAEEIDLFEIEKKLGYKIFVLYFTIDQQNNCKVFFARMKRSKLKVDKKIKRSIEFIEAAEYLDRVSIIQKKELASLIVFYEGKKDLEVALFIANGELKYLDEELFKKAVNEAKSKIFS